jgi:hypothetical protein
VPDCLQLDAPGLIGPQVKETKAYQEWEEQKYRKMKLGLLFAKAVVLVLTRSLARLLASSGITVNAISPGFIKSGRAPASELAGGDAIPGDGLHVALRSFSYEGPFVLWPRLSML